MRVYQNPEDARMKSQTPIALGVICALVSACSLSPETAAQDRASPKNTSSEYVDRLNGRQAAFLGWSEQRFQSFLALEHVGNGTIGSEDEKRLETTCISVLSKPSAGDGRAIVLDVDGYSWRDVERFKAINALAAIRSKAALPVLLRVATENIAKDNRERWMATRALGIIGDTCVIPDLITLLYFPNQNVRLYAQISLVRLAGPAVENYGYDWKEWARWWSSVDSSYKLPAERKKWALFPDPPDNDPRLLDPVCQKQQDIDFINSKLGKAW
jgi:PBS lyase HEAT-like repeat